jgi:hypothetical protein
VAADFQEFEGALGALARGDVAGEMCQCRGKFGKRGLEEAGWSRPYMCTRCLGATSLSSPTRALPVALTRFSPFLVRGKSVVPVCFPEIDHSVSPCRTMKQRGVVLAMRLDPGLLLASGNCTRPAIRSTAGYVNSTNAWSDQTVQ